MLRLVVIADCFQQRRYFNFDKSQTQAASKRSVSTLVQRPTILQIGKRACGMTMPAIRQRDKLTEL